MKWIETITPKQAVEELGVPYHGWMREMDRAWISEDQKYSVMSRLLRTEWGKVEHVTITAAEGVGRSDGSGDIPWAVKMEIKNDLFGEKRVAVEVFPTQDRLVDVCDCYHLWVFEKGFQLPFGIHPRDKKTVTVNRGSTRVRAIDGAGREHSIKELLEENGAADVPKQAYATDINGTRQYVEFTRVNDVYLLLSVKVTSAGGLDDDFEARIKSLLMEEILSAGTSVRLQKFIRPIMENVSGVDYIEIRGVLSEKPDIEGVADSAMLTGVVPVSINQQPVVTMNGIRVVKA